MMRPDMFSFGRPYQISIRAFRGLIIVALNYNTCCVDRRLAGHAAGTINCCRSRNSGAGGNRRTFRHKFVYSLLEICGSPWRWSPESGRGGLVNRCGILQNRASLVAFADRELRRMASLREIYRRDEFLASRLEQASQEIIDGEFSEAAA
jgi:hypothetical protein